MQTDESPKIISRIKNVHEREEFDILHEYIIKTAKELGDRQGFYVLDLADIMHKVKEWRRCLPNVKIFYAVKTNSDPILLKFLHLLGTSFDCATEGEIRLVLEAGASSNDIIFAHTIKTISGLKYASKVGVDLMTFDCEDELLKIHQVYPTARLIVRLAACVSDCKYDLSKKFGCDTEEAMRLVKRAEELGVEVIGVSFHVGSLCADPRGYVNTIYECQKVFNFAKSIGLQFSILDIGGGFFGATGTEEIFYRVSETIMDALKQCFSQDNVTIIAEPGCYIAGGSAFKLACTVIGKKCATNRNEDVQRYYFVNDGTYGSFYRNIDWYGVYKIPMLSSKEIKRRLTFKSTVYGQTCCSTDVIETNCVLPELYYGEIIVWDNMGAYQRAVCSQFCCVPLPVVRYIFDERMVNQNDQEKKKISNFLKKYVELVISRQVHLTRQ